MFELCTSLTQLGIARTRNHFERFVAIIKYIASRGLKLLKLAVVELSFTSPDLIKALFRLLECPSLENLEELSFPSTFMMELMCIVGGKEVLKRWSKNGVKIEFAAED